MTNPIDLMRTARMQAQREQEAEHAERELENDVKWVMSRKEGRRFMAHLLGISRTYQSSFNTNALQMAHSEGSRNVGNQVLALLQTACPERYIEMLSEKAKDGRDDRRKSN